MWNSQCYAWLLLQHCGKTGCPPGDPSLNAASLPRTESAAFFFFVIWYPLQLRGVTSSARAEFKKSKTRHVWKSFELKRRKKRSVKTLKDKRKIKRRMCMEGRWVGRGGTACLSQKKSISAWESTARGWSMAWFKLISTAFDLSVWPYTRSSHSHRFEPGL